MRKFRCLSCGVLADFGEVDDGIVTFMSSRDQPGPPCASCDGVDYVRCGTTTEFYRWTRRADICQVGDHVDARVQRYVLAPRVTPIADPTSGLTVVTLTIGACPDHVDQLRASGVNGFFLIESR